MAMNRPYRRFDELPREIPVFPLAGCLLLPRSELPLNVFEPRYLAMVDAALAGDRIIGIVQPTPDQPDGPAPRLYPIGCAGKLTRFTESGDGRYLIALEGICRFRIEGETTATTPYRTCAVGYRDFADDLNETADESLVDRDALFNALHAYAETNSLAIDWDSVRNAPSESLVNALSMMSPFGVREKQALLEAVDLRSRAEVLVAITEIELAGGDTKRAPLH